MNASQGAQRLQRKTNGEIFQTQYYLHFKACWGTRGDREDVPALIKLQAIFQSCPFSHTYTDRQKKKRLLGFDCVTLCSLNKALKGVNHTAKKLQVWRHKISKNTLRLCIFRFYVYFILYFIISLLFVSVHYKMYFLLHSFYL